jgi:hypothetical protein
MSGQHIDSGVTSSLKTTTTAQSVSPKEKGGLPERVASEKTASSRHGPQSGSGRVSAAFHAGPVPHVKHHQAKREIITPQS